MNNTWTNALALANRAGKVVSGDRVLPAIRNNSAKLVLIANEASDNTKKRYNDKSNFYKVPVVEVSSFELLSKAIGKHNRMYVAITDQNFATMILNKMKEE